MKGSRVQNVVQELQGARIDIVPWSPDPAKYVYNALAPAEVTMVIVDEDQHSLLVVVPDDQLSLAIGRQGQNVRLASRLLSWRIDVKSEQRYENLGNPGYKSLLEVDGMSEPLADKFMGAGIYSSAKLAEADLEQIMDVAAVNEDQAAAMKMQAAEIPVAMNEAEALFADAPEGADVAEESVPGNLVADDVQIDEVPEVSGNLTEETVPEQQLSEDVQVDGNAIVPDEPEKP
jgi:N utilization substance protein A